MLTRKKIMEELINKGYTVELHDVVKNGVELQGITMGNGNIRPTIYVNDFLERYDDELDGVIEAIIEMYNDAKEETFDIEHISEWDFVKTKLQLCLQKKGNENIVKRDFLDLEQYIRVIVDSDENGNSSFKVAPNFLETWNITEDILFNAAWDCTKPTLIERNMLQIMSQMTGMSVEEIKIMMGDTPGQIVLTNNTGINGAIAMCDSWLLGEIADRYKSDLVILPSSIHEIIVLPMTEKELSVYDRMVYEVNEEQLPPEEVLSNHAYRFDRNIMKIIW